MKEKKDNIKKAKIKKEKIKKDKTTKKPNKFIEIIKKKWLIKGSTTLLLVAIIVAVFIAINVLMQNLELAPLDFTEEKLYSLTDASKERIKNIEKDVNMYFIGYTEESALIDLAKQYHNANEKIVVEAIDINNRPDLANKYGIESGSEGIIIECGEKSKVLTENDLYTYDSVTYETINIAEEKLTSSIASVSSEEIPKVYFLQGYSSFSLNQNLYYLSALLENEVNEIDTLDILSVGKVPEDCDTLVIMTPSKDFDDIATTAITNYIQAGGNILWMNAAVTKSPEMPNVNKILDMYCVKPFEVGIIRETDTSKMVMNAPDLVIPEVESGEVTKDIYNTTGVIMVNPTKINVDEDKFEEAKVTKTDLLLASSSSYYRTNFSNQSNSRAEDEEEGTFIVGAELEKTIREKNDETGESELTSKLLIYGENVFISDYQLTQESQYGAIQLGYNKDLILNSIAYLVDRQEDIVARKSTGTVTYTATEMQDTIIRIIIFAIPVLIIIVGIIIWQVRRRKK